MPRSRLHLATAHFLALGIAAWPAAAHAQSAQASASSPSSRIYRCGNAYTNDVAEAQARGCRLLEVDASDDSRPILERLGFTAVTTTTPYVWTPPA